MGLGGRMMNRMRQLTADLPAPVSDADPMRSPTLLDPVGTAASTVEDPTRAISPRQLRGRP